jgi:cob(I)alamin adenosyltransferase
MLYTKKGDDGKTGTFGCDQRISKSSAIAEALGSLDEINSFLGLCKVKSENLEMQSQPLKNIVHEVQKNLFIVQAEVAGSEISITKEKVDEIENIVNKIEQELPPIKSFFISGGSELATLFDIARTIARRAERRVVAVSEEKTTEVSAETLSYLNRLSSLLYALARFSNYKFGVIEESPDYQ